MSAMERAWTSLFVLVMPALGATACSDDEGMENEPGGDGSGDSNGVDVGARVIDIMPERFFPEGVTVDKDGNFYVYLDFVRSNPERFKLPTGQ